MSASTPISDAAPFLKTPADFSLVLGGPLYQLWRGAHLTGDALELLRRRIVAMTVLAWAPLLLLSIAEGRAWGDAVRLPFLYDVELHVRLLVALPLFVLAELIVHLRMRPVVAQFVERGLIPDAARPQFDAAIAAAMRLRNSITAEVLLIALVYVVGVGFIWRTLFALDVASLVAQGTMLAGMMASKIFYAGAKLPDFKVEVIAMVAVMVLAILGPMLVFGPKLAAAKRKGLREYGTLAQRYGREFEGKWLRGGAPPDEPLIGSADIQSLADLGNSVEVVKGMRWAPFTMQTVLQLAVATLVPVVPLMLTMIWLEELLERFLMIVFCRLHVPSNKLRLGVVDRNIG